MPIRSTDTSHRNTELQIRPTSTENPMQADPNTDKNRFCFAGEMNMIDMQPAVASIPWPWWANQELGIVTFTNKSINT
jgi:hypothetical protein